LGETLKGHLADGRKVKRLHAAHGSVALMDRARFGERGSVTRRSPVESASFAGCRFPPDVILLAVRWYLRYGLSYRDVEELLAERGIDVDHVTIYWWVQRFTPELIDAARPCRHAVGDRWFVGETYVKVAGVWQYVYRAVDRYDQVIDVYVSKRRNLDAARYFFTTGLIAHGRPVEVTIDLAAPLLRVVDELLPDVIHDTEQYANNRIENDHGRLKARLRPMRGLRTDPTASIVMNGHAFMQNLRRGHYELGVEASEECLRVVAAFDELAEVI
jgi:IS6 family transposase